MEIGQILENKELIQWLRTKYGIELRNMHFRDVLGIDRYQTVLDEYLEPMVQAGLLERCRFSRKGEVLEDGYIITGKFLELVG